MATITLDRLAQAPGMSDVQRDAILNFIDNAPITAVLPFVNTPTGMYKWKQRVDLGNVGWRGYNENYTASDGQTLPRIMETKMYGGTVQVDRVLREEAQAAGLMDPAQEELDAKMEAAARFFTKSFFKGDNFSDAREFPGLNALLTDSTSTKKNVIAAATNGAVLTMELLDSMIAAVAGRGQKPGTMFLGSYAMQQELTRMWRDEHDSDPDMRDMFGTQLPMYAGIPFLQIGTDEDDDEILAFDETQGSSSITGSLYLVVFGESDLHAIQNKPMEVLAPDESDAKDQAATVGIEHKAALALKRPNAAVRLKGILQV